MRVIDASRPRDVKGVEITPIPIMHGMLPILGYRIGNLAYLTDVHTVPEESWSLLEDVEVLITTALKKEEIFGHMNLVQALAFIEKIGPKRAYLSHVGHELGRESEIAPLLPEHVVPHRRPRLPQR